MKIRPIFDNEEDREILTAWIALDPEHREKGMKPEFFFQPQTIAVMFEDMHGPIFAVRLDPENGAQVRIHIQFAPAQTLRSARTLTDGFPVFLDYIRKTNARWLVFDSVTAKLREFCIDHFGFRPIPHSSDLIREVA